MRQLLSTSGRLASARARAVAITVLALALGGWANPAEALVTDIAGLYLGSWNNLTFGSSGAASIEIAFSGSAATITIDMDGGVFGGFDPPAIPMSGTVSGDDLVINAVGIPIFGTVTGSVIGATGAFDFTLSDVPGGFITNVSATGTISNGVLDLDYSVLFPVPPGLTNPALGTLTATLVPEPLSALLLVSGLVGLTVRRARS